MNKPIYEPRGRAREYGELAVNIYTGCNHGCSYCYAPAVLHRGREEFAEVRPRPGIVEEVRRQLEREKISGKTIFLCFTCDPYPAEIDTTATREVIQAIKDSGNSVRILTKGGDRARRDFSLLDSSDWFGVTISGDDQQEPNAAPETERIFTLKDANALGVNTWVSCEPVLEPRRVLAAIQHLDFIDLFKIGKLNHAATPPEIVKAGGWAAFGKEAERLCREHGRAYYIKDDLRAEMDRDGWKNSPLKKFLDKEAKKAGLDSAIKEALHAGAEKRG